MNQPTKVKATQRRAGTPATTLLEKSGVRYSLHPYDHNPATRSYGLEAADALGVPPEQVFKTLLTDIDGDLVVAIVPVCGSLELKALAAAHGGKRASMAASAVAERATGYVIGGISPFGQRKRLSTIVDMSAMDYDAIYVSAGRRGLDVEIAPGDLVRLTTATTARIARTG